MKLIASTVLLFSVSASAFTVSRSKLNSNHVHTKTSKTSLFSIPENKLQDRRDILQGSLSLIIGGSIVVQPEQSLAFDNKISNKYDDKPKRRGPQPKDLGVSVRKDMIGEEYNGLKPCGPAPNCFCTTDSIEDDPEHNIPAWSFPNTMEKENAFIQLEKVISAYKPGQDNIDGGGFQIVTSDPKKGYMYVKFESLKNGYIDDLEFAYIDGLDDNSVQVRSSSRVGYLDFGVNAKRLNYIAKSLRTEGWTAVGVDLKSHQDYAIQNSMS
mmetsp:Transcript_18422/g.22555  ORF Transcript_18422/g.22555 Transcript_18422/m.22555 type:complete len:268 (-) Transcript_18422:149-952(-)